MIIKAILILLGIGIFIKKLILQDYSTTITVINGDTQMLYPAWPVQLKAGYWQIQPNTLYKNGNNTAVTKDVIGKTGSSLQIFFNDRTGSEVMRFQIATNYNKDNQFNFTTTVPRFNINYQMKCGQKIAQNQVLKTGHPCHVFVYITSKNQNKQSTRQNKDKKIQQQNNGSNDL